MKYLWHYGVYKTKSRLGKAEFFSQVISVDDDKRLTGAAVGVFQFVAYLQQPALTSSKMRIYFCLHGINDPLIQTKNH